MRCTQRIQVQRPGLPDARRGCGGPGVCRSAQGRYGVLSARPWYHPRKQARTRQLKSRRLIDVLAKTNPILIIDGSQEMDTKTAVIRKAMKQPVFIYISKRKCGARKVAALSRLGCEGGRRRRYAGEPAEAFGTRQSSIRSNERLRLTRWSVERCGSEVERRRPNFCVGGKEKWFAQLECPRDDHVRAASLKECMRGLLVVHRLAHDGRRCLPSCWFHYCQLGRKAS